MASGTADAKRLLSLFQELCHYWNELGRGNEEESLALIELLEKMRLKWLDAYNENLGLKAMVETYEGEAETRKGEVRDLKAQLVEARAQIASLVSAKQAADSERDELERQIDLVRELLKGDVHYIPEENQGRYDFLKQKPPSRAEKKHSYSMLDDTDLDYDHTDDSIEEGAGGGEQVSVLRSGRRWARQQQRRGGGTKRSRSVGRLRPSAPPIQEEEDEAPRKRSKEDREIRIGGAQTEERRGGEQEQEPEEIQVTTTLKVPGDGGPASVNVQARRSLNRSFSEPQLQDGVARPPPPYHALTPRGAILKSTADLRSPVSGSNLRSWTSGSAISLRRHLFVQKTNLKPEHCDLCRERIGFGKTALKCQDCHYTCHTDCREGVPIPCVPKTSTPVRTTGKNGIRLADFCPSLPPYIPHLVIHCVVEVERRGLEEVGLYRISGNDKEVRDLLEEFRTERGIPNLKRVSDIHVLTNVIKRFLGSMRDRLIPNTSWHEFVRAAESKGKFDDDFAALHQAISELPWPNRDTLAYIMLHLKNVAEYQQANKMPAENLAKVFGPTMVGYFSEPSLSRMGNMAEEQNKCENVFLALLSLPRDYWQKFMHVGEQQPLVSPAANQPPITPRRTPGATILGPIGSGQGTATPKSASMKTRSQKRFFQPPWK